MAFPIVSDWSSLLMRRIPFPLGWSKSVINGGKSRHLHRFKLLVHVRTNPDGFHQKVDSNHRTEYGSRFSQKPINWWISRFYIIKHIIPINPFAVCKSLFCLIKPPHFSSVNVALIVFEAIAIPVQECAEHARAAGVQGATLRVENQTWLKRVYVTSDSGWLAFQSSQADV